MTASSSQGNPALDACIALIGSVTATALVVLSIIALVGDSNADLRAICSGTNLWWALLVDTLVIGGGAVGQLHLSNSADDAVYAVVRLACMLGVAIWGLCEALSDCANDHLAGNNVRKMVLIWSGLVIAIPSLLLLAAAAFGMGNLCWSDKKQAGSPPRPVSAALKLAEDDDDDDDGNTTVGRVPRTDFRTEV